MEREGVVYKSRIDLWLILVLAIATMSSLYATFELLLSEPSASWLALLPLVGAGLALPLWLLNTRYVLSDRHLTIHSGPFRWKILIGEITSITPTRNPLSSPALSLDRLRVDYGAGRSVLISPRDKAEFISRLEKLQANLR